QDGQRQFWSNPADVIDQQAKEIAFRRAHESVENLRILAHVQMRENFNRLTDCWKFVVTRKRNKNLVANTANIDRRLRRQRVNQAAMEKGDHGPIPNRPPANCKPTIRA